MGSIKEKRSIKRWTEEEVNYILKNYKNFLYVDIAAHLNRSLKSVSKKIDQLRNQGLCERIIDKTHKNGGGRRTLSFERVKLFIEIDSNSGCKLVSKRYVSNVDKLELICKCNQSFYVSWDAFKRKGKRQCNKCGIKNRPQNFEKKWNQRKVTEALIERVESGLRINQSILKREDSGLYLACCRYFGSLENAISKSGFNYDNFRLDSKTRSASGKKFERIVDSLLCELNINYQKYKSDKSGLKPDYIFPNSKWGDAKLAEWTLKNSDTLKNYEPHCKSLTIFIMYGNPETDRMITKKTRIVSVYNLIKQLPKNKRKYYNRKITQLKQELRRIEYHKSKEYIKQAAN